MSLSPSPLLCAHCPDISWHLQCDWSPRDSLDRSHNDINKKPFHSLPQGVPSPALAWQLSSLLIGAPQFCFLHWRSLVTPQQTQAVQSKDLSRLLAAWTLCFWPYNMQPLESQWQESTQSWLFPGEGKEKCPQKGGKYQGHLGNLCCKYVLLKLFLCLVGRFWVKIPDRSSKHTHCLLPP